MTAQEAFQPVAPPRRPGTPGGYGTAAWGNVDPITGLPFNAIWTRYIISVLTSETYSDQEIGKAGLYRYAQSPAFAILLFAYSLDGGPVQVVDQASRRPVCRRRSSTGCLGLHQACLQRRFRMVLPEPVLPSGGQRQLPAGRSGSRNGACTMLHRLYCGYTAGLDATGKALGSHRTSKAGGGQQGH